MTTGRRREDSAREDELLSRLYQQVTDQQAARFAAGYDMAAALDRYRAWVSGQTDGEQARPQAAPAASAVLPRNAQGSPRSAGVHGEERAMTGLPGFTVDIDQNPYLPAGGRDVSAVVTVTADAGRGRPAAGAGRRAEGGSAEIIIIDCSGSMDYPPAKLAEARAATAAAVDVIRDGTWFAIVAGTEHGLAGLPAGRVDGGRERADPGARPRARCASCGRTAGTAIGQWLRLAHQIFQSSPGDAAARHLAHRRQEPARDAGASWPRRSRCARAGSAATAGASAPTGRWASCARSPRRCSARSTSCADPAGLAADFEELMRGGDEQAAARRAAAGVDAAAGDAAVRQAGRARRSMT